MTGAFTFDICMISELKEKSCMFIPNKTRLNSKIFPEMKDPEVGLSAVNSDSTMKLFFTQSMDAKRLSRRGIKLLDLKVV